MYQYEVYFRDNEQDAPFTYADEKELADGLRRLFTTDPNRPLTVHVKQAESGTGSRR